MGPIVPPYRDASTLCGSNSWSWWSSQESETVPIPCHPTAVRGQQGAQLLVSVANCHLYSMGCSCCLLTLCEVKLSLESSGAQKVPFASALALPAVSNLLPGTVRCLVTQEPAEAELFFGIQQTASLCRCGRCRSPDVRAFVPAPASTGASCWENTASAAGED